MIGQGREKTGNARAAVKEKTPHPNPAFTAEDAPGLPGVSGAVPVLMPSRWEGIRTGGGEAKLSRPLTVSLTLPELPASGNGHEKLEELEKAMLSLSGTVEQVDGRSSIGEAIRFLRREKKISQEDLAKRAHVARSTIVRIECGIFKSISVETLDVIAKAFELDLKSLLLRTDSMGEALTLRGHVSHAAFILDYPDEGFRILSLIPKKKEFFFGRIEIQPERAIPSGVLPHPDQVCLNIIEGEILLTREGKSFRLKAGDYLAFPGPGEYELQNTQLVKPSLAFLVTYPSFVTC